MKLQEFVNMGKKLNDNMDFDPEFLTGLYYSIEKEPLALHSSAQHKRNIAEALSTSYKKKQEMFV
jgi:Sec7-like guanine-nucleotide exchange factor